MIPFVVSDVNQWSSFFDALLAEHKRRPDSAFTKKIVTWPIYLINTATTRGKDGEAFNYYQVVDTGRAAVGASFGQKGSFIVFAGNLAGGFAETPGSAPGGKVYTKRAQGTPGYAITATSVAAVHANFTRDLITTFNKWVETAEEAAILASGLGSAKAAGFKPLRLRTTRRKASGGSAGVKLSPIKEKASGKEKSLLDEADAFLAAAGLNEFGEATEVELVDETNAIEALTSRQSTSIERAGQRAFNRTYKVIYRSALKESENEFNAREMLLTAEAAAARARATELQRLLQLQSASLSKFALSPIKVTPETHPAIKQLAKLPNWVAVGAIFVKLAGEQVENIFKPNTPSRQETRNFKLIYGSGGNLTSLTPASGGSLRNGYKLIGGLDLLKTLTGGGK